MLPLCFPSVDLLNPTSCHTNPPLSDMTVVEICHIDPFSTPDAAMPFSDLDFAAATKKGVPMTVSTSDGRLYSWDPKTGIIKIERTNLPSNQTLGIGEHIFGGDRDFAGAGEAGYGHGDL